MPICPFSNPALLAGLPSNYLSLASFQLAGRGRGKNQWLSPPGCLQFSLLLTLPRGFPANKLVFTQYIAALAICRGLDDDGKLGVRLKWPNDIYAEAVGISQSLGQNQPEDGGRPRKGRAKMGGILVNSSFIDGQWRVIVGCGINILNDLPTSSLAQLWELSGRTTALPSMESSLAGILIAFDEIWHQFVEGKSFEAFLDEYTGRWLHTYVLTRLTFLLKLRRVLIPSFLLTVIKESF